MHQLIPGLFASKKKGLQHVSMVRLEARKSSNVACKESFNDKHVCLCLRFFKKNVHNYTSIKLLSLKTLLHCMHMYQEFAFY
jgi:hypothetical protein